MIIAGIGARARATSGDLVAAVREACARSGIEVSEVGQLSGLDRAQTVAALRDAASQLNVAAVVWTTSALRMEAARCVTQSEASVAATDVPSIAEAAALAAAGPDGMLILPRIALATVTVALAVGPGAPGS